MFWIPYMQTRTDRNFKLLQLTEVNVHQLQKTVMLQTATMLRKHRPYAPKFWSKSVKFLYF